MSFQVYMNEKINCQETRDIPEDLIIRLVGKICMVSVSYLPQTFGLELSLNGERYCYTDTECWTEVEALLREGEGPAEIRLRSSYTIGSAENIFRGDEENHTTDEDVRTFDLLTKAEKEIIYGLLDYFAEEPKTLFNNLSYKAFLKEEDSFGLYKYGKTADGQVFCGQMDYSPANEIPDGPWECQEGILCYSRESAEGLDLDRINQALAKAAELSVYPCGFEPSEEDIYDLWIEEMKMNTAEDREKYFSVYRELQEATGGAVWSEPEFVDQEALRMLKIRFDEYNMPHAFLMD